MSSPISIPKATRAAPKAEGQRSSSPAEFPSSPLLREKTPTPSQESTLPGEPSKNPVAEPSQIGLGQTLSDFVQSFSPLSLHEHPSLLLSSSLNRAKSLDVNRPGTPDFGSGISFGTGQGLSSSLGAPAPVFTPPPGLNQSNDSINHPEAKADSRTGSVEKGFVVLGSSPALSSSPSNSKLGTVPPAKDYPVVTNPNINPIGPATLLAASSASNLETQRAATSLFSSLASFFSKREITGSFDVILGTNIRNHSQVGSSAGDDHEGLSRDLSHTTEFLSAHFNITKDDMSTVDQIIVQKLLTLFNDAQRNLSLLGLSSSSSSALGGSIGSVPPLNFGANATQFAQTLQSTIGSSSTHLMAKMETAVEWTLQARTRGYGYKGIGKMLREISIIANPPHDLHLTHVPLFLHSVPQLELLTMRHHSISTIPAFVFYISNRLTRVILADSKIKTLFAEVPRAKLADLVPAGTPASFVPPPAHKPVGSAEGASTSTDSAQTSSENSEGDPLRKTDLLEHLTSPLSYFVALQPPSIEYLDLSGNVIAAIPPFIANFKSLATLNLARNQLSALPGELSGLPALTELNIDNNYIYDLPSLPNLQTLSWRANGLKASVFSLNSKSVLGSLSNTPQLTSLDISNNFLDQLPYSVLALAKTLTTLIMASNQIWQVQGTEISTFVQLKHLDLASNKLKVLPSELFHLPLQYFNVSDNQLTTLPSPLNFLSSLVVLNLSKNQLKQIPFNVPSNLESIGQLDLRDASFSPLNRLEQLDVSQNKLIELPDMFEELGPTLTSLDVSNNLLTTLPQSTGALTALRTLHGENNKFELLPSLGLMRSLQFLDLTGNDGLMTLPRTFVELQQLNEFSIAQLKMTRKRTGHVSMQYDVIPLKPIIDKLFSDRVPQILSLTKTATHYLLLRALHFLCKQPIFHAIILSQNLLFALLSSAKCNKRMSADYETCFVAGQEQIATLIAIRHLAKNLDQRDSLVPHVRPLITILGEHVLNQAEHINEMLDFELYDAEGHKLAKSVSMVKLSDLSHSLDQFDTDSHHSSDQSSSSSSQGRGRALSHSVYTPRGAPKHIQLCRLQNKIRISLSGLCMDIMCYLSWTPSLRDAMNQTEGLVAAVKKLRDCKDAELTERSLRTLAGLGSAPEFKENRGVRILTLDGGGTKGITAVIMLKRIEELTGRRIHEMFDLIVGTSTGAIIATLTAWVRLSMQEAVTYYREACGIIFAPRGSGVVESKYTTPGPEGPQPNNSSVAKVFSLAYELDPEALIKVTKPKVKQALAASPSTVPLLSPSLASSSHSSTQNNPIPPSNPPTPSPTDTAEGQAHPAGISASWTGPSPWARFTGFFEMLSSRSFYDNTTLETVLKNLGDPQATLLDTAANGDLRLIFTSTEVGVFPPRSFLLRNYNYADDSVSRYEGTSAIKMWEALRSSTAAPAYFDGFTIAGRRLSDGGISTNNPAGVAVQESKALWPNKKIDVVLSCGVGNKASKPVPVSLSNVFGAVVDGATETEKTSNLLEDLLPPGTYYRLQPIDDVFDFPLDETKIERLDQVEVVLNKWMDDHDQLFRTIAAKLLELRHFDDEKSLDDDVRKSSEFYRDNLDHLSGTGPIETEDAEIAPSPLRPIPSRTSIMDSYSPLDELQQWDDDM